MLMAGSCKVLRAFCEAGHPAGVAEEISALFADEWEAAL